MPRAKRRKPYDPAMGHDRRSAICCATPKSQPSRSIIRWRWSTGEKIVALRSIRNDPLARLHSTPPDRRGRNIRQARVPERLGREGRARAARGRSDPGNMSMAGKGAEPITEGQRKAVLRLNRAERELGADGSALVHDVLVQGPDHGAGRPAEGSSTRANAGATYFAGHGFANASTAGWRCCMGSRRSIGAPSKPSRAESQRLHDVRSAASRCVSSRPG